MQRNNNAYFIGIDGGGSHCRARLTDASGKLLGEGKAGPANFRLGLAQVQHTLLACCQQALHNAGMHTTQLATLHAGIGLAGAVLTEDADKAAPITGLFASCQLKTDAYIACLGAHMGEPGGILILGTGSCAQLISPEEERTFGGWGFTLGDQASGAWLGHQAIRLTLLAMETVVMPSTLTHTLSAAFDHQPARMLAWSMNAKPADFARFAPQVIAAAQQQDVHALTLLQQASQDACQLIRTLQQHGAPQITLLGGLAEPLTDWLPASVRADLSPPKGDALDGALLLARRTFTGEAI